MKKLTRYFSMFNIKNYVFIIIVTAFSIVGSSLRAQVQEDMNILFIGNSFTFRHDLNLLVEEIVREGKPNINIYMERVVSSSQSIFQHTK